MPKAGDTIVKNGKDYIWTGSESSGFWSQIRKIEPVDRTFCPACLRVRDESNPSFVMNGINQVFYKIYGMCQDCYTHVNANREKFLEEHDRLTELKANYNKPKVEENG